MSTRTVRDTVTEPDREAPTAALFEERVAQGWSLVALEWEQPADSSGDSSEDASSTPLLKTTEIPFGLRVASDCHSLEEDAHEVEILKTMLEMFVEDRSFGDVASTLNERGFRDRAGQEWTQVSVFQLVPRLVEVGPDVFGSKEWSQTRHLRRRRLAAV